MVDNSAVAALFAIYVPEFYPYSLRNRQFQEGLDLVHLVPGGAPKKPKEVHPILQPAPVVPRMGGHELLHLVVHVVYGVHRVLGIPQSLRLGGGVNLAFKREGVDEGIVRGLAVVDKRGSLGDVSPIGAHARLVARLGFSNDDEDGQVPVGRGCDVVLASPRKRRAGPGLGPLLCRIRGVEELLVGPYGSLQDDVPLDTLQHGEDLGKPVATGRFGVPIVRRGGLQRMVFEEMQEEFDPFRYRYLPGIKYGSGERGEAPSASEAFVPLDPVVALPVPGEKPRSAMRAVADRDRVDEGGFLRGGLPVLLLIPFQNGGFDEPFVLAFVLAPRPGKLPERRKARPLVFVFHMLGGRLFRGSVPGPPSQSATFPGKGHCMPILRWARKLYHVAKVTTRLQIRFPSISLLVKIV